MLHISIRRLGSYNSGFIWSYVLEVIDECFMFKFIIFYKCNKLVSALNYFFLVCLAVIEADKQSHFQGWMLIASRKKLQRTHKNVVQRAED